MVKYNVKLFYSDSCHLYQLYDGFCKLEKQGICRLEWIPHSFSVLKPILKTEINGKIVYFDCLDGYNWINASLEDNINAYHAEYSYADYYFKRSYNPQYKIGKPLGLNYAVYPDDYPSCPPCQWFKENMRKLYKCLPLPIGPLTSERIEYQPRVQPDGKVIFLTRLWDPKSAKDNDLKIERKDINDNRIALIESLRKEFGDLFIGGVSRDKYSLEHCPKEMLVPHILTYRKTYIKTMHNCNIGIATDGLHKSIGWKFSEYVASSKAIVTERLKYEVTGDFCEGKNYICYDDNISLIKQVRNLMNDETALLNMMMNNCRYYNRYIRSDQLVLRALEQI